MPALPKDITACTGFQWDAANSVKIWERHRVSTGEVEQVFFNRPVRVARAKTVSGEDRYAALGLTSGGRLLTVVFTVRENLVRPISARDMSRPERQEYERAN